jgi:hypothetical protein
MRNLIIIMGFLLIMACSGEPAQQGNDVAAVVDLAPEPPQEEADPGRVSDHVEIVRKLIKEGEIEFETSDPEKIKKQIVASAASHQAYIASDQQAKSYDKMSYVMVIRIPAAKFDSFLKSISKDVDHFDKKEVNVKDVTAEYIDGESRLKTKKEIEDRYRQLLQKASNVNDILNIEKELGNIRTEIESTEGQLKLLKDQIQYSTLNISFYSSSSAPDLFSQKLSSAFADGWGNITSFFLIIVSIWPFLLLAVIFWLGMRKLNSKKLLRKTEETV